MVDSGNGNKPTTHTDESHTHTLTLLHMPAMQFKNNSSKSIQQEKIKNAVTVACGMTIGLEVGGWSALSPSVARFSDFLTKRSCRNSFIPPPSHHTPSNRIKMAPFCKTFARNVTYGEHKMRHLLGMLLAPTHSHPRRIFHAYECQYLKVLRSGSYGAQMSNISV